MHCHTMSLWVDIHRSSMKLNTAVNIFLPVGACLVMLVSLIAGKHEHEEQPFVGEQMAEELSSLKPEEIKAKLEILIKVIDVDKDGFTDASELQAHIKRMQKRYIDNDINNSWNNFDKPMTEDGKLSFKDYTESLYGQPSSQDELSDEYKELLDRDKHRWNKADLDEDGKLSKEEYGCFLHPESCPLMADVIVEETMKDIDKNGDGFVDLDEYITDMYRAEDYPEQKEEPEWVKSERQMFKEHRDKDKDGKMDREELKEWLMPTNFDHAEAESRHLIHIADDDSDGKLSVKEILDHYETFVGSQVTDYGEQLQKHDPAEL
ncbi:Calumenin [Trichinella pseudospiralis]|nr:Calumenin [Trichinella pseudospiralis]KRZ43853.1 Calumenin [Trichinella pseudospiralis]